MTDVYGNKSSNANEFTDQNSLEHDNTSDMGDSKLNGDVPQEIKDNDSTLINVDKHPTENSDHKILDKTDINPKTELEKKLEKSLLSAYLYSSIPPFIALLSSSLLVFADGLIISNVLNEDALASLTYSQIVDFFIRGTAQIFATGAVSVLGALIGNKQDVNYRHLVPSTLLWTNIILYLLSCAILIPLIKPLFKLIGAKGRILDYAYNYSIILSFGNICYLFQITYNLLLLSEGLSKHNMISSFLSSLLNPILSFLLIKYTNLDIYGAAIGSLISVTIAGIYCIIIFNTKLTISKIKPFYIFVYPTESFKLIKKMFIIGIGDAFAYYAFSLTFCLFNYYVSEVLHGDDFTYGLASYGGFGRLYGIFSSFLLSFGSLGYLPVASYYVGEKNVSKLREITKLSIIISFTILEVMGIIVIITSQWIARIFSTHPIFIYYFKIQSYIFLPTCGLGAISYILTSFGQSLGLSVRLLVASTLNLIISQPLFMTILYFASRDFKWLLSTYIFKDVFSIVVCLILFYKPLKNSLPLIEEHLSTITKKTTNDNIKDKDNDDNHVVVVAGDDSNEKETNNNNGN